STTLVGRKLPVLRSPDALKEVIRIESSGPRAQSRTTIVITVQPSFCLPVRPFMSASLPGGQIHPEPSDGEHGDADHAQEQHHRDRRTHADLEPADRGA